MRKLILAILVSCVAISGTASASPKNLPDFLANSPRFRVSVRGGQVFDLSSEQNESFPCGVHSRSQASESISFQSAQPVDYTALGAGSAEVDWYASPVHGGGSSQPQEILLNGWVDRRGSITFISQNPAPDGSHDCGPGGSTGEQHTPSKPDCGKRTFTSLSLQLTSSRSEHVGFDSGSLTPIVRYKNCPFGKFPTLLLRDNNSKTIDGELLNSQLLNKSLRKIIVSGSGKVDDTSAGIYTTIHWTITFERI